MLREKRQALILEYLRQHGSASIHDLVGLADISGSTVRRDLKQLGDKGYIQLTHGGAVMPHSHLATFEMDASIAAEVSRDEKMAIGGFAAGMVAPGQTIIFDSSTTVLEAARRIATRQIRVTAITNNVEIARILSASPEAEVVVTGGSVRRGAYTLTGEPGLGFLAGLHADMCFLGTHAIGPDALTETSLEVVAMKRAIMRASRRIVVLADSTKFRLPALYHICDTAEIDEIVTDTGAGADDLSALKDRGVTVRTVSR